MTDHVIGTLFDDKTVKLDPRTLEFGGAWYDTALAYEPDNLRLVYQWAGKRTDTVLLDVGASTGAFCLLAAHVPGMRAFAFEPVPDVYDTLHANLILNNIDGSVRSYQRAVGKEYSVVSLHVVEPASQRALSMINGTPSKFKRYQTMSILEIILDEFCQDYDIPRVDAIKIDVEGGELYVLEGAAAIIERDKPALMIEYSAENTNQYGYNPDSIETFLRARGYRWRVDGATLITSGFWEG